MTKTIDVIQLISYVQVSLYFALAYVKSDSITSELNAELHIMDAEKGIAFMEHLLNE